LTVDRGPLREYRFSEGVIEVEISTAATTLHEHCTDVTVDMEAVEVVVTVVDTVAEATEIVIAAEFQLKFSLQTEPAIAESYAKTAVVLVSTSDRDTAVSSAVRTTVALDAGSSSGRAVLPVRVTFR
jgi:hypothetical protein